MSLAAEMATLLLDFESVEGESATFTRTTGGSYNTTTRQYDGATTTNTAFTGIFLPFDQNEVDGSNILVGDVKCYARPDAFEAAGVTPEAGDVIVRGSQRYKVTPLETYVLGGSVVAYAFLLRGIE